MSDPTVQVHLSLTTDARDHLARLGGSEWVAQQLAEAGAGGANTAVRRLADVLRGALQELCDATGRPDLQAQTAITLLSIAASAEPLPVLAVAERVGFEKSSASRNIAMLTDEGLPGKCAGMGLLHKTTDPTDARRRLIRLSPKGEAVMRRLEVRIQPLLQAVAAKLR
jgi:DNA-binding MarR family transcriptional regulator